MYSFPIGVILESFRTDRSTAIKKAAAIGANGIQMYATQGENAPENLSATDRKALLKEVKDAGLVFSALCGDLGKGFGNKDIASKAGCPEWAVRKYQAQCRAYSLDDLKRAVRDGVAYEEDVKTGRMNDQMAVELFIVQYSADMTGTHTTGSK